MRVIEYFTSEDKERWLNELKKCDWEAGQFLHQLLSENKLKQTVGQTALVLMLVDGDRLISFCTFAPMDDIQPTKLSPWIGFLYTFPEYRGNKYAGTLLDYAESLATVMEREYTYISTNHVGLYEKYGYEFYKMEKDIWGEDTRVYRKNLTIEGEDKTRRLENGAKWKGQIVKDAKKGTDMVAFLLRESALMYCAVRRKVLTAAMNVMSCKTAPKDFMGQITVMPLPAKPRVCLSNSTEKINL